MTLRMGDAVDPNQLPGGLDAYAGYIDGSWADFATIARQHPTAHLLPITVFLTNSGDCLDIETGDATPDQAPAFVRLRQAAGVARPVLYGSISVMPAIVAAMDSAGISRPQYRLWSAHYTYSHICGPATCAYQGNGTPAVDGTQWTDHGGWDESLLADDFFGGAPTPPPPKPKGGKKMWFCRVPGGQSFVTDGNVFRWLNSPDDYNTNKYSIVATGATFFEDTTLKDWHYMGVPVSPTSAAKAQEGTLLPCPWPPA